MLRLRGLNNLTVVYIEVQRTKLFIISSYIWTLHFVTHTHELAYRCMNLSLNIQHHMCNLKLQIFINIDISRPWRILTITYNTQKSLGLWILFIVSVFRSF
jgi:hypothetical protein